MTKPYVCTNRAEAGYLIAAGFAFDMVSEVPLELHFAPEARSHANRRKLSLAGLTATGRRDKLEKRFLPAHHADRM